MGLGVPDLPWKLAAVVAAGAPVALLETYETEPPPRPHQIDGEEAARTFGAPGRDVFCLVRPDGYLALRCGARDRAALEALCDQTFGRTRATTST